MTRLRTHSLIPARRAPTASRPQWHWRFLLTLAGVLLSAVIPTVAHAGVIWTGDAEQPASQQWASSSANGAACAIAPPDTNSSGIQQVSAPSPVAQGKYSYHFQVSNGDDCYGARAELGENNPTNPALPGRLFYPGEDRWISFQAYFPDDYQLDDTLGQSTGLLQLKQEGADGPPALGIGDGEGYLCMFIDSTWYQHYDPHCGDGYYSLGMPAKDTWIKLTLHVDFSTTNTGFVEVWGDLGDGQGYRLLLTRTYAPTMKVGPNGQAIPSGARIGIYRSLAISGTEDLYVDGFTVATDEASADANAFAPPSARAISPPTSTRSATSTDAASTKTSTSTVSLLAGAVGAHRGNWIDARGGIQLNVRSAVTASTSSRAPAVNPRRRVALRERFKGHWRVVARGWTTATGTFSVLVPLPRRGDRVLLLRASIAGIGRSKSVLVR
jgi:hypothetical protein